MTQVFNETNQEKGEIHTNAVSKLYVDPIKQRET